MFGKQLYPTPRSVVMEMLEGLKKQMPPQLTDPLAGFWWLRSVRILDPSAGRGDILDVVRDITQRTWGYDGVEYHKELYAIEIGPDLRSVLKGKGYQVIDSDFLQHNGHLYFDVILMNPSFVDGEKHLLKAWEISRGGIIKCLLNASTLKVLDSMDRKRLKRIVDQYGSVKELGQPFLKSDRPSDVEVVLVTLQDPHREDFRLPFDPSRMGAPQFELEEIAPTELAPAHAFDSYEAQYDAAVVAFKELLVARQKVGYYLVGLIPPSKSVVDIMSHAMGKPDPDTAYDEFVRATTRLAWDNLFNKTKLSSMITENVRSKLAEIQAKQGDMAFTAGNMDDLWYSLMASKTEIVSQCILDAFDALVRHFVDNPNDVEGWYTNSSYRIDKFILPNVGREYPHSAGLRYNAVRKLEDLERALCFLSGKRFDQIKHIEAGYQDEIRFGEWVRSEFFDTKLFQRGTMHFRWVDKNLRDDFNAFVARERPGRVPAKTKKGVYR